MVVALSRARVATSSVPCFSTHCSARTPPTLLPQPTSLFRLGGQRPAASPRANFPRLYSSSAAGRPRLGFGVAASYNGKGRPYNPATHVLNYSPRQHDAESLADPPASSSDTSDRRLPFRARPENRPPSGHDAFFVTGVAPGPPGAPSGAVAMGIADGVGGWVDSGIDPADFSHTLCVYMARAAATPPEKLPSISPGSILEAGYTATCFDRALRGGGGSTACVAIAAAQPTGGAADSADGAVLDVANLGDSGFVLLRSNAVHTYSTPQTHAFNTPFQLSLVPPAVAARMAAFGGAAHVDLPRDADRYRLGLRRGDVLVLATDGMWDNLSNQDVLRIVSRVMTGAGGWTSASHDDLAAVDVSGDLERLVFARAAQQDTGAEPVAAETLQAQLATSLVAAAKHVSMDRKANTPFSRMVRKHHPNEIWSGGKVDDICVVVLVVANEVD